MLISNIVSVLDEGSVDRNTGPSFVVPEWVYYDDVWMFGSEKKYGLH